MLLIRFMEIHYHVTDFGIQQILFNNYNVYVSAVMQQNQPFREAGTNLELNLYSKNHQLTRYQELLSNNLGPLYFEPAGKGNFLAKGQLAPNEDAVFNNWGRAAFSLANVIPQWQVIYEWK